MGMDVRPPLPLDAEGLAREQQIEQIGIHQILPPINSGGVSLGVGYQALLCTYTEIASQMAVGEHTLDLEARTEALKMGIYFLADCAQKLMALKRDLDEHGMDAVRQWQDAIRSQSTLDKN